MKKIVSRALELFSKGKFPLEVKEIILHEFPRATEFAIEIKINYAWKLHNEKSIPDENYINQ